MPFNPQGIIRPARDLAEQFVEPTTGNADAEAVIARDGIVSSVFAAIVRNAEAAANAVGGTPNAGSVPPPVQTPPDTTGGGEPTGPTAPTGPTGP